MAYKPGEDGRYDYRISPPKTAAGTREVPMLDEVKSALLREKSNQKSKKKFVVEGCSGFVFLNSAGQVYTNSLIPSYTILSKVLSRRTTEKSS